MPASTTYTSREIFSQRDGLNIYGQLFTPVDLSQAPLPTIVCAHGFGANYLSCVPYAWALVELGYAVCCFDFCGGGYAAKSEGNPLDMTLLTERDDIASIIDALLAFKVVDENRIYVLGEGLGGLAATLFVDEYPVVLRGLILVHPSFNLHDQTRKLFPTKKNIPASYRQQGMRVGRSYGEIAWDTNPYAYMHNYMGDVLILHGDEDTAVPLEYSRRANTVFASARLEVVPHGRHVFKGEAQMQCLRAICDFLQRESDGDTRLRGKHFA